MITAPLVKAPTKNMSHGFGHEVKQLKATCFKKSQLAVRSAASSSRYFALESAGFTQGRRSPSIRHDRQRSTGYRHTRAVICTPLWIVMTLKRDKIL